MQVTVPRERLYEQPAEMTAWMLSLLRQVPFSAASLGLALEGHDTEQYELGTEHLALDISKVDVVTDDVGDDLHQVAWLTALGPELVKRLGGRPTIERGMGELGEVVDAASGVLVTLGAHPSRGSTEQELAPYRALARILGPALHVPREVSYFTCAFSDGSGKYNGRQKQMQEAWHQRLTISRAELARVFQP
jgi:hypothetical protein